MFDDTQRLFTVTQLSAIEPALGVGSIRSDLFYRETNGLEESGAIIYRGRRILIDRDKYLGWMASGKGKAA